MKFHEALRAMVEDGKRVSRRSWAKDADYFWKYSGADFFNNRGQKVTPFYCSIITADDWEIVPETMGFMEAVDQLRDGYHARRKHWRAQGIFAKKDGSLTYRGWSVVLSPHLSKEDVFAKDWIVEPIT